MTRVQLEHVILAAGAIADTQDLVVIGSQAILGGFPNAPSELLISNEADLFPREHAERSELIDGSIGEGSPFEHDRLIPVTGENTRFVRGWCLEVHDLAIAKYAAGREKDLDFTKALARHGMIQQELLEERLAGTPVDRAVRSLISARIRRDFARAR